MSMEDVKFLLWEHNRMRAKPGWLLPDKNREAKMMMKVVSESLCPRSTHCVKKGNCLIAQQKKHQ